jgi:bacterial/archaeal transporter family protein
MEAWFWLAMVALVFFGISGVTQKLSTNAISFEASFLWLAAAFVVISVVLPFCVQLEWSLTAGTVLLAAVGGLLNGLGVLTSFAALEKGGKASVVIPLINLYPLVTTAGACLFLGERLTRIQVIGIVCAVAAVYLLSQEPEAQAPPTDLHA